MEQLLSSLSDNDFDTMDSLHVYGNQRDKGQGMSALFITRDTRDVYGIGFNCLLGKGSPSFLMHEEEQMENSKVKIDALSGIRTEKIVIGAHFGAALTEAKELYFWGDDPGMAAKMDEIVMFRCFIPQTTCEKCDKPYGSIIYSGRISLSYCSECNWYPTYTLESPPPPGILVYSFFRHYSSTNTWNGVYCVECGGNVKNILIWNHKLLCCSGCKLVREVDLFEIPFLNCAAPSKVELGHSIKLRDIFCGEALLVLWTYTNRLIICGSWGKSRYKDYVRNPDKVVISKVACGRKHVAVVTSKGELYTCGGGSEGQLGYEWKESMGYMTLRKAIAKDVVDVSCGRSTTVSLMKDGTFVSFNSESTTFVTVYAKQSPFQYSYSRVIQIPSLSSEYIIREIMPMKMRSLNARAPFLTGEPSDGYMKNLPCKQQETRDCLYGEQFLSDLTLKLADVNFPVHRSVLYRHSRYFKEILVDQAETLPEVQDMSSYNPEAYRCLLKYFYSVPLGKIDLEVLVDLYILADSYKETPITEELFNELLRTMNVENVLLIHKKAASAGAIQLLKECQTFMNAPDFKLALVQRFDELQNTLSLNSTTIDQLKSETAAYFLQ